MISRRFLVACAIAALPIANGCGGTIAGDAGDDARTDAASDSTTHSETGADSGVFVADTRPSEDAWIDPGCGDVGTPPPDIECDPFDPNSCGAGFGCYTSVTYPSEPCAPEIYVASCYPAGTQKQGEECDDLTCAPGFECVASGAGNVCGANCHVGKEGDCPEGYVCEGTDVPGYGVCL